MCLQLGCAFILTHLVPLTAFLQWPSLCFSSSLSCFLLGSLRSECMEFKDQGRTGVTFYAALLTLNYFLKFYLLIFNYHVISRMRGFWLEPLLSCPAVLYCCPLWEWMLLGKAVYVEISLSLLPELKTLLLSCSGLLSSAFFLRNSFSRLQRQGKATLASRVGVLWPYSGNFTIHFQLKCLEKCCWLYAQHVLGLCVLRLW